MPVRRWNDAVDGVAIEIPRGAVDSAAVIGDEDVIALDAIKM